MPGDKPGRGLHLLIELAKRTADEHRGSLGRISAAKAEAEAALAAHEQGLESESRIATDDPAVMATLSGWTSHTARARSDLRVRKIELDRTETAARDALRSAFMDLKRLEMARDTAARQDRMAALRRDQSLSEERFSFARSFVAL